MHVDSIRRDSLARRASEFIAFQVAGIVSVLIMFPVGVFLTAKENLDKGSVPHFLMHVSYRAYSITYQLSKAIESIYSGMLICLFIGITLVLLSILAISIQSRSVYPIFSAFFALSFGFLTIPISCFLMVYVPRAVFLIFELLLWINKLIIMIADLAAMYWMYLVSVMLLAGLWLLRRFRKFLTMIAILFSISVLIYYGTPILVEFFMQYIYPAISYIYSFIQPIFDIVSIVLSTLFGWIFWVLGWVFAIAAFTVSISLLALLCAIGFSIFGHLTLDTLFDARNVSKGAVYAGRFLIGVGVFLSFFLLGLSSKNASIGAMFDAINMVVGLSGEPIAFGEFKVAIDSVTQGYLILLPDRIEFHLVRAFSAGGVPGIETIVLILSCYMASYWILKETIIDNTGKNNNQKPVIAFVPWEMARIIGFVAFTLIFILSSTSED